MTTKYIPVSVAGDQTKETEEGEEGEGDHSKSLIKSDHLNNTNIEIGNVQQTDTIPTTTTTKQDTLKPSLRDETALDPDNASTVLGSSYNIANSAVGAGILSLSYGTGQVGYGLGIFLFIACCIMTAFTFIINAMACHIYRPKSSYKVLSDACFPYLAYFTDFIIALNTFGACCAYLIIIGDLWPDIMRHFSEDGYNDALYDRRLWIALFFVVFIMPCIYFRKFHALRRISAFGMWCYIYITITVLVYSIIGFDDDAVGGNEKGEISAAPLAPLNFFKVLPMFLFAYACLFNVHPVVNELGHYTKKKINIMVNSSMAFTFTLYVIMGFAGYATFGSNAEKNLLVSYPTNITAILVARILLSFCVAFSYPVLFAPCRHCLATLFFQAKNANKGSLSTMKFIFLTTFIWVLTIVVSMTVDDLGYVIAVDGALAVTAMTLILPGLFYWYIKPNDELIADPCYKCKKYTSMILTILGCFLAPFCVAMIFVDV